MNNQKIDRPFANLEPILWKAWIKAEGSDTTIIGYWAEDNSTYFINAPYQLINSILQLQNTLSKRYLEWCDFKNGMNKIGYDILKILRE